MRILSSLLGWMSVCLILVAWTSTAVAQKGFGSPVAKGKDAEVAAVPEYSLTEEELDAIQGQTFDVLLKNGKKETGLTLKVLQRQKQNKNEIRLIEMTQETPKKTRKFPPNQVRHLEAEGQKYEVQALASQKSFVLIDATKRLEQVNQTLESQGRQLWPELTTEEREKFVAEDKAFLETMKTEFPDARWNLVETESYLFLSELPGNQASLILKQVDRTCEAMATALGAPSAQGNWRGKCVIVTFSNRGAYQKFEQLRPPADGEGLSEPVSASNQRAVTIRMYKDGRVIIGGYLEDSSEQFGVALVRAVARGYLYRYQSDVLLPFWVREGIADWMTGVVLPGNKSLQSIQKVAVNELQSTGALGDTFFITDTFEVWECGVAAGMVQLMAEGGPAKFQSFINGMKAGKNFQDALQEAYAMTLEDLMTGYGRAIGIQELKE